jgi:uncharacterized membrane protein YtjA (UPF0391 family)
VAPSAARLAPFGEGSRPMLYYAIVFAVLALIAGFLGFMAPSGALGRTAESILLVFVILFVFSLIFGRVVLSLIFGRRSGPAL